MCDEHLADYLRHHKNFGSGNWRIDCHIKAHILLIWIRLKGVKDTFLYTLES
uniref:Uncharacterized protein n=1 Tax=Arundo donax TaxID=35708 RepID=A0A0A9CAT9_ARUDO